MWRNVDSKLLLHLYASAVKKGVEHQEFHHIHTVALKMEFIFMHFSFSFSCI